MPQETLRESVMMYAAALRRTAVPPERAVVLVKRRDRIGFLRGQAQPTGCRRSSPLGGGRVLRGV